jgi:hypothetical protein
VGRSVLVVLIAAVALLPAIFVAWRKRSDLPFVALAYAVVGVGALIAFYSSERGCLPGNCVGATTLDPVAFALAGLGVAAALATFLTSRYIRVLAVPLTFTMVCTSIGFLLAAFALLLLPTD